MLTAIVSDLHLSDAELPNPKRPLWKAYKRREHFFDAEFRRLLDYLHGAANGPSEIILNGDVFDFDNITRLPKDPPAPVDWLARLRGLGSEEWMSVFKIDCIIADHLEWFDALAGFVRRGHRVVFIIGNHDVELHWPKVQERIRAAMNLTVETEANVVFCNWFYLSAGDTYVSHGNQYDPYCTMQNPIDPLISRRGKHRVRIPFGDLAERYMLNGMGYFNPHSTDNYLMTARQYFAFFAKYMLRTQPLLLWTWFWSAAVTLWFSLWEFWSPALSDPLLVEEKAQSIADRSQATPSMVRKLNALNVPSACTNPYKIMRELWLDRGLLFLIMVYGAFQLIVTVNFVWPISPWWVLLPLASLFPFFILYSFKVRAAAFHDAMLTEERAQLIAQITGCRNVVFGHTHKPETRTIGPVRYANSGFWSPAFAEPACVTRIGRPTVVLLKPSAAEADSPRELELCAWPAGTTVPVRVEELAHSAAPKALSASDVGHPPA